MPRTVGERHDACGRTFGSHFWFERHQTRDGCMSLAQLRAAGLRRDARGVWRAPDPTKVTKQRRLFPQGRRRKVGAHAQNTGNGRRRAHTPQRPPDDNPSLFPGLLGGRAKTLALAALAVVLLGVAFPTASADSDNAAHHRRCVDIPWRRGPAEIRAVIRCKVVQIDHHRPGSIPGGVEKSEDVADCESSDDPEARTSEYGGVYQIGATSDRHGEWRDWEPHLFWRYHRKADPRAHGRFNGFFNIARALGHVAWIVRHPRVGPWYGRGWGPWSCA